MSMQDLTGGAVAGALGIDVTPPLSDSEAARVAAFGLDEPEYGFKPQVVAALRLREQASYDEAARIRSHYDEGGALAPAISDVIRQESRAQAFREARVLAEQDGAVI